MEIRQNLQTMNYIVSNSCKAYPEKLDASEWKTPIPIFFRYKKIILMLLGIISFMAISVTGQQSSTISLEEALSIARKNNAGLERDRLSIEQQSKLAQSGLPLQPAQLYVLGEEFDFSGQSGVHSINVLQNFYLPKVNKAHREYYQQSALVAQKQLALTNLELQRQVELAYYQLLYAKQEQELIAESLELYDNFLGVATAQLESGETGKIPQLAARTRLGQAQLEQEYINERYQIAFSLFNLWLQSDTLYDIQGELNIGIGPSFDTIGSSNPHLQIIRAQQELAMAKVKTEKAQLLPQINSGLKLHTALGNFPLFGYQVGVNIPLFKKAYQGKIEAAELEVKIQDAHLKSIRQQLERNTSELIYRLEYQLRILEYLQQNLTPIVNEHNDVNLTAYNEGEIGYLEYLDGLEQAIKVRQEYLNALYTYNILRVEFNYWIGR